MYNKKIVTTILVMLIATSLFSQIKINGTVYDARTLKPLRNVQVLTSTGLQHGTITENRGKFSIFVPTKKGTLLFRYIGYKPKKIAYKGNNNVINLGTVLLTPQSYSLDEITISSGMVNYNKAPVSITEISAKTIDNELSDRPLPIIFNEDPAVFAVRNGGGSGDASLSIRGFKQENVALLLNGIPINGEENGLVYWSNWLGLNDVSAEIQIQKGPGFANLASNAVGGSINIITKSAGRQKGVILAMQTTSYGNKKVSLSINSGKTKNNWQIAFAGSWFGGPGYIDATYVKGFSYFIAASKKINSKNKISFTLIGAPQYHQQRTLKLSNKEVKIHGFFYNKDWGSLDGQIKNASANFYHKPFFIVSHNLKINTTTHISNTIYFSYGIGGGLWTESFEYAPSIFSYKTASGQINWNTIYNNNANNNLKYILENGDTVSGYSNNIGTQFLASHIETGCLSNYKQQIGKHITLLTGLYYRYFNSFLREQISDLMGGKFFIEDYAWSLVGVAGRNQIKTIGDIVKVNNHSIINNTNLYSRLVYKNDKINAFVSIKGNNSFYQRIDKFNYTVDNKSKLISRQGYDIRAGIGFGQNRHFLYINGAHISKVPYFKFVFGNFTNVPVSHLQNEIINTIEGGFNRNGELLHFHLAAFYTLWHSVSMLTNEYVQLEDNKQSRSMINGLNALHKGVEMTLNWKISTTFRLAALATFGDYRWKNNVTAKLINNNNVVIDTIYVFVKDLHVGGTAQQKFGLIAKMRIFKNWNFKATYFHYGKLFADFNPVNRNIPNIHIQDAFMLPAYNIVNLYLNIPFHFFGKSALFQFNGYNIFNNHYIETGEDGANHDLKTFRGFWSFGRNISIMLKFYM